MIPLPYNDYGSRMRSLFGGRIQKLALDAGLSCPNRDGSKGFGGCSFCLNEAFSPSYCRESASLSQQIDKAIDFHNARGRNSSHYLAYLQSGSNTYSDIRRLQAIYEEALSHPNISGLIIGTRPDCISSDILDILDDLSHSKYIAVEYGIESVYDVTLRRVNRGHDFKSAVDAIAQTKARGIDTGAHFIVGLPGESHQNIIDSIAKINQLGIDTVKFHQLQIYRGTAIEREFRDNPQEFLFREGDNADKYVQLICDILRHLDPRIAVERFITHAPRHLLSYSPLRGIRPDEFKNMVIKQMLHLDAIQGDLMQL